MSTREILSGVPLERRTARPLARFYSIVKIGVRMITAAIILLLASRLDMVLPTSFELSRKYFCSPETGPWWILEVYRLADHVHFDAHLYASAAANVL